MSLAALWAEYPDQVTADLAEYYHIYDMRMFRPSLIAVYVTQLRNDSRTIMAAAGEKVDLKTLLIAKAVDGVNWLIWSKTKPAQHGRGMPKSICDSLLGVGEENRCIGYDSPESFSRAWNQLTEETNG